MKEEDTGTEKILSYERIDIVRSPEDLEPGATISINPPPSDGRCQCCRRNISELTPFGGPGDPLKGDFSGVLLIKNYRPAGPYIEEAEKAHKEAWERHEADGYDCPIEWMKAKYGEERGFQLYIADVAWNTFGKSWECRDCAILYDSEYFERLRQRYREEKERDAGVPEKPGPQ